MADILFSPLSLGKDDFPFHRLDCNKLMSTKKIIFYRPLSSRGIIEIILQVFEAISRMRVNLPKCSVGWINMDMGELLAYSSLAGRRIEEFPLTYLGVLLGGNPRPVSF